MCRDYHYGSEKMAYTQHRPDLISFRLSPGQRLTLSRHINGLEWTRVVKPNDFLTPMEAAVVLGVHRVTLYSWIRAGAIKVHRGTYGSLICWRDLRDFGKANGYLQ